MGISMITAWLIFTNPGDLEIIIGQEEGDGKFGIGIFLRPGHNYKPMLTSRPFADTQEDAIKAVEEILQAVREGVTKELEIPGSLASQYLNPNKQEIDQSKILNQELIARILNELRQHQKVSTHKMIAPAG